MSTNAGPPESEAELEQFADVLTESLNFPRRQDSDFMSRYRRSEVRLIRRRGRVAGGLVLLPCGQFFGRASVPMAAVHAVAIAPEARGTGAGRELVTAMVAELTAPGGPPLAALYPATQPLYRSGGFEQAGCYTRYRVPIAAIPVGPHDLEVERLDPGPEVAADALGDLYRRFARRQSGFVDRTPWFWQRVVSPLLFPVTVFAVREAGAITGYLILRRTWTAQGQLHSDFWCREMVAETPGAARRLWTLLADERSLGRTLLVQGPPVAADHLFFTEQALEVDWQVRWMLRILDVEAALTARGYPPGLEREVAIELEDELVERNRGGFAIDVAHGRAEVRRGAGSGAGAGAVRLDVRALAALYSGYLGAEQLAGAGMASGSPEALAALSAVFAGPPPWLAEMF